LVIHNLTTNRATTIPTPDGNFLEVAAWSPNGKQIAVVTEDKRYKFNLYIMNADGANASLIPPLPQETEGAEMIVPDMIEQIYWVP